ncbi:hypothetical protein LNKW23_43220 [Paralimibaculum aggregatum]|uniref:Uncharacterized protein n=1 Tax=Paralimibaculum aggregatum TaxID=3036245 RepID=A0ABQ6LSR2_9RHOB|nr:hypothetical protein LNKW23_43220 [Limibaculum sp. NKW23]
MAGLQGAIREPCPTAEGAARSGGAGFGAEIGAAGEPAVLDGKRQPVRARRSSPKRRDEVRMS